MADISQPTVSIVIPMRNEEQYIAACLSSVVAQDYPNIIEILVLDGRSTDRSAEIVQEFAAKDSRIRLVDNPGITQPAAGNLGFRLARGEVVARLDAHALFAKDYISRCIDHLQQHAVDVVGSVVVRTDGFTPMQRAIGHVLCSRFGVGVSSRSIAEPRLTNRVAFGLFRRELLQRIGSYNEALPRHEDVDLFQRIADAGGRVLYAPDVKFTYFPRPTLRALWHQSFSTGHWTPTALRHDRRIVSWRQLVPGIGVAALMLISVLAIPFAALRAPLLMALGAYLLAVFAASIQICRQEGWNHVWRYPLAFLALHWGYALGTLGGLVRPPRPPVSPLESQLRGSHHSSG